MRRAAVRHRQRDLLQFTLPFARLLPAQAVCHDGDPAMTTDNLPRRDITHEEARRRTDEFKVHAEAWLRELVSLHDDQVW